MSRIDYNKSKNEVTVTGCVSCPFSFSTPKAEAHCELKPELNWYTGKPNYFPTECPLRDPNFKITRVLE